MVCRVSSARLVSFVGVACAGAPYCSRGSACWPSSAAWTSFEASLTGSLQVLSEDGAEYAACWQVGTDALGLVDAERGLCFQQHDCANRFCGANPALQGLQLPGAIVEVHSAADIALAFEFARTHNLA